eukprot:6688979-Alexandrium_andersonii.AAC.1
MASGLSRAFRHLARPAPGGYNRAERTHTGGPLSGLGKRPKRAEHFSLRRSCGHGALSAVAVLSALGPLAEPT